ncbi:MAG TPA: hypothetical protein VFW65_03530 [Pseudonocardiaceae bacterium]|nr:hypothetical protein [Pseudonocardiaceae bacterium]
MRRLYLRVAPGWWAYSEDRRTKRAVITVAAEDDRGGTYAETFGGSDDHGDHEEVGVRFLPALDPLGRGVTLTFRGTSTQVAVRVDLGWS